MTVIANPNANYRPIPIKTARVMIVDDTVENLSTTTRLLMHSGVAAGNCIKKTSGSGVVQFAEMVEKLDLILLDLGLPDEDGYQILQELRRRPQFANTLVVVITGHTSLEEMRKAQDAGFDGFIGKPLQFDRFPDQLSRILSGNQVWECR
jgi:two-component system cell cycle response regulator DivK